MAVGITEGNDYICCVRSEIRHRVTTILLTVLLCLACGGCRGEAGEDCRGASEAEYAGLSKETDNGLIEDARAVDLATFILSAKNGEPAIGVVRLEANPAPAPLPRRVQTCERRTLAHIMAKHLGSTVIEGRFGMLEFKHIIHSNHSLLLRICSLLI